MTTLYKPVLIESAEQAEALPVGTFAVAPANTRWAAQASVRVRNGWHCTGETEEDGDMTLIQHRAMVGDTALVPIEAEEEWAITYPEEPPAWSTTTREGAQEAAEHGLPTYVRHRTAWEAQA